MYLKIMSAENIADGDNRKTYRLLAKVTDVQFLRIDGKSVVQVMFEDSPQERFDLVGNAYLLNEDGKTIDSFGVARAAA